jgi:hypothetical protein
MAKTEKPKAVQVHMSTPSTLGTINQMTWVPVTLKLHAGMVIETKGDSRPWTVVAVYHVPAEMDGLADWTEVARVAA